MCRRNNTVGNLCLLLLLCLSTPAGAQADNDTPPLRPILCLALRFAPAQFHASQLLLSCPLPCVLRSSSVSTTLRCPSQSFFRYTAASFPHFVPNPGPLPTSNRCLHGILLTAQPCSTILYWLSCLSSWCWRFFLNSCWWRLGNLCN